MTGAGLHGLDEGRRRAVVEGLAPRVDGGRFPIKRVTGESVTVEADAFTDGHDVLACVLCHRHEDDTHWTETWMTPVGNDRWRACFACARLGRYRYRVTAWVDHFLSWRHELARRDDPRDIMVALLVGAELVEQAAARAGGDDAGVLAEAAQALRATRDPDEGKRIGHAVALKELMLRHAERGLATDSEPDAEVVVDPPLARCGAWYELFPRSAGEAGRHGSLADVEARLPYVAALGFDVLYLPPIHPIGRSRRKGPNNALSAGAGDPGSPWAIGAEEGGHDAVHPALGGTGDLCHLVERARAHGIELALDIAFQCSPDHPWVRGHPEWFRHRPDGSVQYAENPPKKYQDIYPFDFETPAWRELFTALLGVVRHWVDQGVRVFRVDNPHTKPFTLWEWLIAEVKRDTPEAIFLAEAFTRPRVMHRLAKLGFTQSYTYFAWRNTKAEISAYLEELTQSPSREYFRPNLWPNTPDILPEYLQLGGRAAFTARLVLAATLAANYGVYGPAFELLESTPREAGSEEYLDSEKYQLRAWDLQREDSLRDLVARVNRIRRENPALQSDWSLRFVPVDDPQLIAYTKSDDAGGDVILVVVNLDPHHAHAGWVELPLERLGVDPAHPFQVHELLSDARYLWHGSRNYVALSPDGAMAHVLRLRRRVRTEHDFDYFM